MRGPTGCVPLMGTTTTGWRVSRPVMTRTTSSGSTRTSAPQAEAGAACGACGLARGVVPRASTGLRERSAAGHPRRTAGGRAAPNSAGTLAGWRPAGWLSRRCCRPGRALPPPRSRPRGRSSGEPSAVHEDLAQQACTAGCRYHLAVGLLVLRYDEPVTGGVHGEHGHGELAVEGDVVR